jgi:RND family efflux transporter MFP subunit
MSDLNPQVDLSALARSSTVVAKPKRRFSTWLIPILVVLAAGAIFSDSLLDLVRPVPVVQLIRPTPVAGGQQAAGTPLFQAAGWVEPDPAPILVTALEAGVIMDVRVQAGDAVKSGDVVARLADEEQRLNYAQAEVRVRNAEAMLTRARAELAAAELNWSEALAVTEALASAEGELKAQEAEVALDTASVTKAEALVATAKAELAVQEELLRSGATSAWNVELAKAKLKEANGELLAMQAEVERATADVKKSAAKLVRASKERELRIDDRLRHETAKTGLVDAEAKLADAITSMELERLRLSRTQVRAPLDGIVLERRTGVGSVVGPDGASPSVVSLYDPQSLRIRVDVPQDKISGVQIGAQAEILSEARREQPYQGEVTRIVHTADINKVTLQVHVRVKNPDSWLRPEMLCQVRFLASATPQSQSTVVQSLSIPEALVHGGMVWVFDPVNRSAHTRRVDGFPTGAGNFQIKSGINLTDKLISAVAGGSLAQLEEGMSVRPEGQ